MKITGYKFQHALREAEHEHEILGALFGESLMAFDGEEKDPQKIMEQYAANEEKIVRLQVAQAQYNGTVTVVVLGHSVPLSYAVKAVGGAGRMEKMWRSAAKGPQKDRWERTSLTRNVDEIRALPTIDPSTATGMAKKAARYASALREAIQVGNATEIDIPELEPALFE